MSELSISNVVTVSVATPPSGLQDFQVNNLLILTKEVPANSPGVFGLYLSPTDVAADWGTGSEVYAMANLIFGQSKNILSGDGTLIIANQGAGETLADAIARLNPLVFFGGVLSAGYDASASGGAEILAAAAVVQPLRKLLFASSYLTASVVGFFTTITSSKFTYTRNLLYTQGATPLAARLFAAAYAGRAMSTAFDGSATTQNMHMKDLEGMVADGGITQTVLDACLAAGVDTLPNIGGLPKVFTSGANLFFDQIYNQTWFVFGLQVAGFNAIATTSTKLPQTEPGVAILRGAYIGVLKQAVVNGYIAPGQWNSPDYFGNVADLQRNILQTGFYLYSQPVVQQPQTQRAARKAPLIQIAIKEAGGINSSNVIVNVEA